MANKFRRLRVSVAGRAARPPAGRARPPAEQVRPISIDLDLADPDAAGGPPMDISRECSRGGGNN